MSLAPLNPDKAGGLHGLCAAPRAQRGPARGPLRQRGAAILAAMLTVTLVATFAAAAMWQQFRAVEIETAERARVQAAWILTGALDWSRLILREDARAGGADHLAEPWAVPLQEARLSTFLAADKSGAAEAAEGPGNAFLSGEIVDLQARLNARNLLEEATVSQSGLRSFQRLFELLGLPAGHAGAVAENLRAASQANTEGSGGTQVPLKPQQLEQLVWVGLPADLVETLRPYVTVLPDRTPVNLNTAPPEVIAAAVDGLSLADAQRLVAERASSHLRSPEDAARLLPAHAAALKEGTVAVGSRYFEVRGRLRLDQVVVEERSLMLRDGTQVRTLQRERGVAGTATAGQAPTLR